MAAHSSWKGYLRISLVAIPLKAYTAANSATRSIELNQLHEPCKSRIKYQKVCPTHGVVANEEIVSGYEYAKNQYAVIDTNELEQLRTENDHAISIDSFVRDGAIDDIYLSGHTYYLVPDGPVGQKPYAIMVKAMSDAGVQGVGRVVMTKKERLVRLRAVDGLLAMELLQYASQIKSPASFQDELPDVDPAGQELEMARTLVSAMITDDFEISKYRDQYTDKLTQLIESKVDGKELVAPQAEEAPAVINLMEALKESVRKLQLPAASPAAARPAKAPRKTAPSGKERKPRKKKETG
jgi:DNA end-binding protein Ku